MIKALVLFIVLLYCQLNLISGSCIINGLDFSHLNTAGEFTTNDNNYNYTGVMCGSLNNSPCGSNVALCAVPNNGLPIISLTRWNNDATYNGEGQASGWTLITSDNGDTSNSSCKTRNVQYDVQCGSAVNRFSVVDNSDMCDLTFELLLDISQGWCQPQRQLSGISKK